MTALVAQIAPQRSTQYAAIASALAAPELLLSPLGPDILALEPVQLGGRVFLKLELGRAPDERTLRELGTLAMTSAFFEYYERVGDEPGPFLRPLDTRFDPVLPPDLPMTRRYKGKTNELFTHFLCNAARFSSRYAHQPWTSLRLFDPLAGGCTTLFVGLVLGADVAGVEQSAHAVELAAAFLRQYTREQGIACKVKEERLRKLGRRWQFAIGKEVVRRCVLAAGDTLESPALIAGFGKPHLIVADLPYGIQHEGQVVPLLKEALPVWAGMLQPGGAMALAWESTRLGRSEMLAVAEAVPSLEVLDAPPYNALAHRVDRVIKQRDVLVARVRG